MGAPKGRGGYYEEGTQTRMTASDSYVSFAASDKGKADRAYEVLRKIYSLHGSTYPSGQKIYGIPHRKTRGRKK